MKYSLYKVCLVLPAASFALAFGCDGAVNPPPAVTGDFTAIFFYRVDDRSFSETWMLSLRQSEFGAVSGSGVLGSAAVSVDGSNAYPDVELNFTSEAAGFLGTVKGTLSEDGNEIDARYNLSTVFIDAPVTLLRSN